jgi:hypothetical protein
MFRSRRTAVGGEPDPGGSGTVEQWFGVLALRYGDFASGDDWKPRSHLQAELTPAPRKPHDNGARQRWLSEATPHPGPDEAAEARDHGGSPSEVTAQQQLGILDLGAQTLHRELRANGLLANQKALPA